MGKKRSSRINILFLFIILIFSFCNIYGVQVIEKQQIEPESQFGEGIAKIIVSIIVFSFIILVIGLILFGIAFAFYKMSRKLTEYEKRKRDFLYYDFENNTIQAHQNRDSTLKFRNWKFFFIFWKRMPVMVKGQNGLQAIGEYNGEFTKKENFYMLSIYNKIGVLKYFEKMIIIPMNIKNVIVEKIQIGKQKAVVLNCEGIDNVGSTDYYYMPLIRNEQRPQEFLDFSDYIFTNYIEKVTHRDIIRENLMEYRHSVIKAVEMNPNLTMKRRSE